ncbi:Mizu-kussei [Thalictrum thalictroides]|uniref:Mizu-kussei n=1 Tax=Thalictrum thalictroides TaxID=46969 RepID=A0A7J6X2G9_THATH|nr:Mizu-kussei [Thalictrum thalictroides]
MKLEELSLSRSSSSSITNKNILPSNYIRSSALHFDSNDVSDRQFVQKYRIIPLTRWFTSQGIVEMVRSIIGLVSFSSMVPTCRWLSNPGNMLTSPRLGRKVTGTLFGYRKGRASLAVQEDPRSEPLLLLELATSTSTLVKEMSTGLVRIALECEKGSGRGPRTKLLQEPMWTMYCNGKKCGQAVSRTCVDSDWYLLSTVQTVSAGAGVIPMDKSLTSIAMDGGEFMYMRSRFERVVGNRNSEAYYMVNPDGIGGPELSIFFLRI